MTGLRCYLCALPITDPDDALCYGCHQYICDQHTGDPDVGAHDPSDHDEDEDEDA